MRRIAAIGAIPFASSVVSSGLPGGPGGGPRSGQTHASLALPREGSSSERLVGGRQRQFEDQQGDGDREDAVGERVEAIERQDIGGSGPATTALRWVGRLAAQSLIGLAIRFHRQGWYPRARVRTSLGTRSACPLHIDPDGGQVFGPGETPGRSCGSCSPWSPASRRWRPRRRGDALNAAIQPGKTRASTRDPGFRLVCIHCSATTLGQALGLAAPFHSAAPSTGIKRNREWVPARPAPVGAPFQPWWAAQAPRRARPSRRPRIMRRAPCAWPR